MKENYWYNVKKKNTNFALCTTVNFSTVRILRKFVGTQHNSERNLELITFPQQLTIK